jgi:hypothetical protein
MAQRTIDGCALYAGESAKRLYDIVPVARALEPLASA